MKHAKLCCKCFEVAKMSTLIDIGARATIVDREKMRIMNDKIDIIARALLQRGDMKYNHIPVLDRFMEMFDYLGEKPKYCIDDSHPHADKGENNESQ